MFAVFLLIVVTISTAQSPINKIDNYGHTWVSAKECLVLNNGNIIITGSTGSTEHQQQSFHFTQLDTNGELLHSQFYYSPSEYYFIWNFPPFGIFFNIKLALEFRISLLLEFPF